MSFTREQCTINTVNGEAAKQFFFVLKKKQWVINIATMGNHGKCGEKCQKYLVEYARYHTALGDIYYVSHGVLI